MKKNLIILENTTTNQRHMVRGGGFNITQPGLYIVLLIVCILVFQMLTGCCNTLKLAPVVSPPTGVYYHGKFVWLDLLTTDVTTAKNFYGELFGWTFKKQGRYTVVLNKGQPIGGIVDVRPKEGQEHAAHWLASLSVPDVDKAVMLVQKAGGSIPVGPVDMKNRGRGALIIDSQGAQLMLLHSSAGDPADKEPPMGSWLWIELWSNNPEDSVDFYKELGGYSSINMKENYWLLLCKDKWRAGVRFIPYENMEVRWVPVVRVSDTVSISEHAEKLGGQILVQPKEISISGSVALIEDPVGGLLIVQCWSSKQSSSTGE